MARTVNPERFASKRREILDAAQRLVLTKGFEQMAIRDILGELQISSGAFHHYFDSRGALLDALITRMQEEAEKPLLPIIRDPDLSAIEKLRGFFVALDRMRIALRSDLVELLQIWYADDNAVVRQRVDEAVIEQRAPLLDEIVSQGVREGVFTTAHPDKAGEVILSLLQGMGNTHARLLLSLVREPEEPRRIDDIIAAIVKTHAAYMDAVERVLGAPPNSLYRTDAGGVQVWVAALRGSGHTRDGSELPQLGS